MNCTMIMNTMGAMSNRFVSGESIMELDTIHKYNYFFCIYALRLVAPISQYDVIGEFCVIFGRNIRHVNFMTRYRDLVVILLNCPSTQTFFCFIIEDETIFSNI